MSVWRLVITPRWIIALAVTIVFALITTLFAQWQWDRRGQAVAEIERVENNYDRSPVAIDELLPDSVFFDEGDKWRPVVVRGEYVSDEEMLVRTRPRGGSVGFDVVVPFVSVSGQAYLISRGWVPTGEAQDLPDRVPGPPVGEVEVVARLLPGEPPIPGRGAPEGQLATVNLADAAIASGVEVHQGAYLALDRETPAVSPTPVLQDRPRLDEGPHLSYTFQWYLFGILGFIAWAYLLREDYRRRHGLDVPTAAAKKPTDQDIEDALLDEVEQRSSAGRSARG